jgi:hypothetical protein
LAGRVWSGSDSTGFSKTGAKPTCSQVRVVGVAGDRHQEVNVTA